MDFHPESKRTLIFFPQHQLHRSGLLIGYNLKRFYICITAVVNSIPVKLIYFRSIDSPFYSKTRHFEPLIWRPQLSSKFQGKQLGKTKLIPNVPLKVISGLPSHTNPTILFSFSKQFLNSRNLVCYSMNYEISPLFVLYPKLEKCTFLSPKSHSINDFIGPDQSFIELLTELNQKEPQNNLNAIFQQITFASSANSLLTKLSQDKEDLPLTEILYGKQRFFQSKLTKLLVYLQSIFIPYFKLLTWILSPLGSWSQTYLIGSNTRFRLEKKIKSYEKQKVMLEETELFKDIQFEENQQRLLVFHASAIRRWLLLNLYAYSFVLDILLGILFLLFLFWYKDQILIALHSVFGTSLHITKLRSLILWLEKGLPQDLKLNQALDRAFGAFIKYILNLWEDNITTELTTLEQLIVMCVGGVGVFGFQLQLSVIHDILVLCSLHIYFIYRVMAYFYHFMLQMEQTFLRLFRGKKYNIFKKREDTHVFSVDQFVLGMILFAMFTFLLPTIAIYYGCFGIIFLQIYLTEVVMLHIQVLTLTFPLYLYIWLAHFKFSVPCAIEMRLTNLEGFLKIKPIPQTSRSFYRKMKRKFATLWQHCSPGYVLVAALKGSGIPYLTQSMAAQNL